MTRLEAIWDRARSALALTRDDGRNDPFLLEHAVRVARSAQQIARLPEAESEGPDETAVVAAALFQCAAWVKYVNEGEISLMEVLARPGRDDHFRLSATILDRNTRDIISGSSLDKAKTAIQQLETREGNTVESFIVSDAVMLEEFGVASLWPTIRRGALEGQTVQSVIDRWRRRSEYHYWSARLEESFHFEPVRALARRRLERLGRIIAELEMEQDCADFQLTDLASGAGPSL